MKLIFIAELKEGISEIEELHSQIDQILLRNQIEIIKSTLESDGDASKITIHDSAQKCKVCGCDWFHACAGGCYWVKDDLCSKCVTPEDGYGKEMFLWDGLFKSQLLDIAEFEKSDYNIILEYFEDHSVEELLNNYEMLDLSEDATQRIETLKTLLG